MNENTMTCNGRNIFIIDKKPLFFSTLKIKDNVFSLQSEAGETLSGSQFPLTSDIYACLYCDKLKNIIFILRQPTPYTASLIFAEESSYENALKLLKEAAPALLYSPQNEKINGYAAGITEKLSEGIEIKIIDAQKEDSIIYCPNCGTQCDPGIPYCMECGSSI